MSEKAVSQSELIGPTTSFGALAVEPARQWRIESTNGVAFTGPLTWAQNDPSEHGVAPGSVAQGLADVVHFAEYPGMPATVASPDVEGPGTRLDVELLRPYLIWTPLSADPAQRGPRLSFEVTPECFVEFRDLAAYDAFMHRLRTHIQELGEVRDIAARAFDEDRRNRHAQGVLEPQQPVGQQAGPEPIGRPAN